MRVNVDFCTCVQVLGALDLIEVLNLASFEIRGFR